MARQLTASRAQVAPAHEPEYLACLAELREAVVAAGGHFWVFHDPQRPGEFLEFAEVHGPLRHPGLPLEQRLRRVAQYVDDAFELWTELPLDSVS